VHCEQTAILAPGPILATHNTQQVEAKIIAMQQPPIVPSIYLSRLKMTKDEESLAVKGATYPA
jgi:hypothetical protein